MKGEQAIIRDEMRTLEDIRDKNIGGSSVLEYANSINPMLFQEILEAFGKECPLVYDVVESLVISNPRSRNILKTNSHKILCGLQTLGLISNIRNSKTKNCLAYFVFPMELAKELLLCYNQWVSHCAGTQCKTSNDNLIFVQFTESELATRPLSLREGGTGQTILSFIFLTTI